METEQKPEEIKHPKRYVAYIKDEGDGCDHTIACGEKMIDLKAESMDEAVNVLFEHIKETYSDEEYRLETAEIYEVEKIFKLDMEKIYNLIDNEEEEEERKEKEEEEKKEFERLKQKFESTNK